MFSIVFVAKKMFASAGVCSICKKNSGSSVCTGCGRSFCIKDFKAHRQSLSLEIEDLLVDGEEILSRSKENSSNFVLSKITEWEKISISNVRSVAEKLRAELSDLLENRRRQSVSELSRIFSKVEEMKKSENFVEKDLNLIKKNLSKIRSDLENFSSIEVRLWPIEPEKFAEIRSEKRQKSSFGFPTTKNVRSLKKVRFEFST